MPFVFMYSPKPLPLVEFLSDFFRQNYPVLAVVFCLLSSTTVVGQTGIVLQGTVTDSLTNETLIGASVYFPDLGIGDITNLEGRYRIENIPPNIHTVQVSYIGYITKTVELDLRNEGTTQLDIVLQSSVVEGEEIFVLAQAAGQIAAIKEQLESNTIVNVVSKERLSELPDQNAAESVARLPGVSVTRDAGEAAKVVVRGLSPRFNSITINGVRVPGTEGDRSVDLSLLPSDVLDGIQVFKALTPDMDADAVGGTVNLLVKKAPNNFRSTASLETGYNDLRSELGQYKFSLNGSNRFLDNKLGILVSGSLQRANRSSLLFDVDPEWNKADSVNVIENLNFADNFQIRDRYGLSASFDYTFDQNNEIYLSSLFGRTDRDEQRYRKRYRVGNTRTEYDARDRERYELLYSNVLTGNHSLENFEIDWQASYSYTLSKQIYGNYARFYEVGAFETGLNDRDVADVIAKARNTLDETYFLYGQNDTFRNTEDDFTASVNARYNFNLGNSITGYFKAGGRIRDKNKVNNPDEVRTDFNVVSEIGQENPDLFELFNNTHVAISNFIDQDYNVPNINGYSVLTPGLDIDRLNNFYATYRDEYETNGFTNTQDYTAGETVTAAYIMSELNIGSRITFIPGVRYEHIETFYDGKFGDLSGNLGQDGEIIDTTGGQNYWEIFPQFHLKVNIVEGLDLRLAYTQSISRPNYENLVPFEQINDSEQEILRGNPDLRHSVATNYDVFLSYYNPRFGYISVGGFYKELESIDYSSISRILPGEENPGFNLTAPVNAEGISTVKGVEFDIQTDLRFLPKPLDGFILSANIALIDSETFFPLFFIDEENRSPDPPFSPTIVDTVRAGPLPGQPDITASFTIGYEIGLFSARASLAYQEDILNQLGGIEPTDQYTEGFSFWDLRINQSFKRLPNVTWFVNVNNLTSQSEREFVGGGSQVMETRDFSYGLTASSGVKIKF